MTSPIGGPPSGRPPETELSLTTQIRDLINFLSQQLTMVMEDPTLAEDGSFLQKVADMINKSEPLAEKSRTMIRNKGKDATEHLHHLLMQPLGIVPDQPVSLLTAAQTYDPKNPALSDLSKVMRTFASHPEMVQALTQELQLIVSDLSL
jgi:hypothetical protein